MSYRLGFRRLERRSGTERRTTQAEVPDDRRSGWQRRNQEHPPRPSLSTQSIVTMIGAITTMLAVLGYVYTFGQEIGHLRNDIDRNCRFLAIVEADTRFLIIEHTTNNRQAQSFREIFQASLRDTCG